MSKEIKSVLIYLLNKASPEFWLKTKTFGEDQTALHHAARSGNVKIARYLINAGADKETRDHLGRTPLYCAAEYGKKSLALKQIIC